jgi:hypothetical protein
VLAVVLSGSIKLAFEIIEESIGGMGDRLNARKVDVRMMRRVPFISTFVRYFDMIFK